MFYSLSARSGNVRLASHLILRSSKLLLSKPCSNQRQNLTTMMCHGRSKISSRNPINSKTINQRSKFFSTSGKETATKTAKEASAEKSSSVGWWRSPEFWGFAGSIAAWGMSGAAIYDSALQGPEVISLTMTPVLMVYSGLFARWAWVVKPRKLVI